MAYKEKEKWDQQKKVLENRTHANMEF